MFADNVPEEYNEYFDNLEVMIFSGSRHFANSRTVEEFEHIANQCIRQSHQRLLDNDELAAHVRRELSRSPLMPWGTRLDVQGRQQSPSCKEKEPGKVSELLCLLRGPQAQGVDMGDHWIGIVRHDETPYMTGRLSWLVKHIAGRGRIRHLLFARSYAPDIAMEEASAAAGDAPESPLDDTANATSAGDGSAPDVPESDSTVLAAENFAVGGDAAGDAATADASPHSAWKTFIWDQDRVDQFNQLIWPH